MTLLDLAERCERATGPDRELDAEIDALVGINTDLVAITDADYVDGRYIPRYTASLDAALTLVPPGCSWSVEGGGTSCVTWAVGRFLVSEDVERFGHSGSPALGLVAAALRARAAQSREVNNT